MSTTNLKLTPDEFKRNPTCGLLELDPNKPYIVMLPTETPNDFAQKLSADLASASIFAIILTGPNTMKVFSSFPVEIGLRKRQIEVCEDALTKTVSIDTSPSAVILDLLEKFVAREGKKAGEEVSVTEFVNWLNSQNLSQDSPIKITPHPVPAAKKARKQATTKRATKKSK